MINDNKIYLGLDVSTETIGICLLMDDGSENGKILELTHVKPKIPTKLKHTMESLFLKKRIFEEFIVKYKDFGIDECVIEEPLLRSNNIMTVGTLLRFNGMVSDCVYSVLGIVPTYISSYDARMYAFPQLMAIRKFGKDGEQYEKSKILREIKSSKMVLFGSYPWTIDKKSVLQEFVSERFPDIEWLYNKKGELKKENFDASDSYVAVLGSLNKKRKGELKFSVDNIVESSNDGVLKVEYDVNYWDVKEHRVTYIGDLKQEMQS